MNALLIVIIGFIVLIYLYTYFKHKKRKKNQISVVDSYRKNYIERTDNKHKENIDDELKKQITKYNSSVDYIEWNDFVAEINDQKKVSEQKPIKPKRLQY